MPTRTALITSGTTAATSADFVVDAGAPVSVFLKASAPDKNMYVVLERYDGSAYYTVGEIRFPGLIVNAPGTYRVRRDKAAVAFAVDSEK